MTGAPAQLIGQIHLRPGRQNHHHDPQRHATSNTFTVETLTDEKLTLKSTDGAALMLEAD